ncbi:DUF998 domain-containing protein [Maribacter sp. 2308TA10-17]|uniref:DUF998 domain-containing protein n=1 Tax=Maribacter sp. 2308TA10-17 TaxID=3386276 RepID=UPI0039BD0983
MRNIIFMAGVLGAFLFITASIFGGIQIDDYSFISQFISESYATGIPNATYLRYAYIASGSLFTLFGLMAPHQITKPKIKEIRVGFFLFALFYGVGTITTGFFPCDMGCNPDPETASLSQFIHNTTGFLTYSVVPFCLMGIGFSSRKSMNTVSFSKTSLTCGILAFVFVILLLSNPTGDYIGLFQRIVEASVLYWVIYVAFYIRGTKNKTSKDRT